MYYDFILAEYVVRKPTMYRTLSELVLVRYQVLFDTDRYLNFV